MAQHKSAKKRIKQTGKKTLRNRALKARMRTMVKKFLNVVEEKVDTENLQKEFSSLQSTIAKVVQKGIIKKNTGSRYISRLSKKLLGTDTEKVEKQTKATTKNKVNKTTKKTSVSKKATPKKTTTKKTTEKSETVKKVTATKTPKNTETKKEEKTEK